MYVSDDKYEICIVLLYATLVYVLVEYTLSEVSCHICAVTISPRVFCRGLILRLCSESDWSSKAKLVDRVVFVLFLYCRSSIADNIDSTSSAPRFPVSPLRAAPLTSIVTFVSSSASTVVTNG
jgi:hypothetical protein